MNKVQADLYELEVLRIARKIANDDRDKLEIIRKVCDYVLEDEILKDLGLRCYENE